MLSETRYRQRKRRRLIAAAVAMTQDIGIHDALSTSGPATNRRCANESSWDNANVNNSKART
jgi:hypothetical protein